MSPAVKLLVRAGSWTAVVTAAALLAASGNARVQAEPTCGAEVTSDVRLDADLRECAGDGLIVSGDGVTLDLGGHEVRGTGAGVGVLVTGVGVTVRNGTVRGFDQGVRVLSSFSGGDSLLARLTVIRNGVGVVLVSPAGKIDDSSVSENRGDGIRVERADRWTVEDSRVVHNAAVGIALSFARDAVLVRNAVTGNGQDGVQSFPHVDNALVADNVVSGNAGVGISVTDSTTRVLRNVVRSNGGTGIALAEGEGGLPLAAFYVIAGNVSSKNGGAGITACVAVAESPCAPGMVDGGGNTAKLNRLRPECVNVSCGVHRD